MSVYIDGMRLKAGVDPAKVFDIAAQVHKSRVRARCSSWLAKLVSEGMNKQEIWERVVRIPVIRESTAALCTATVEGRTYVAFNSTLAGLVQACADLAEDYSYTDAVPADTMEEAQELAERARIWDAAESVFEDKHFDAKPVIEALIDELLAKS